MPLTVDIPNPTRVVLYVHGIPFGKAPGNMQVSDRTIYKCPTVQYVPLKLCLRE
jgi:hypothetical protein